MRPTEDVKPVPLDRFVPAAAVLAAIVTALILFYGRW